jgi:hypothetical protein
MWPWENSSKVTSLSEVVNTSIANVMISQSKKAAGTSTTMQTMTFKDIIIDSEADVEISNITQTASVTMDFKAIQDSNNSAELTKKLQTEIEKNLKSEISGLGLGNSASSESISRVSSSVTSNVNIQSISECLASAFSTQTMTYSGLTIKAKKKVTIGNISQLIVSSLVAKCTQSDATLTKAIEDAQVTLNESISSKNTGFDLTAFLSYLGMPLYASIGIVFGLCVCIIIVSSVSSVMLGGGGGGGQYGPKTIFVYIYRYYPVA